MARHVLVATPEAETVGTPIFFELAHAPEFSAILPNRWRLRVLAENRSMVMSRGRGVWSWAASSIHNELMFAREGSGLCHCGRSMQLDAGTDVITEPVQELQDQGLLAGAGIMDTELIFELTKNGANRRRQCPFAGAA